MVIHISLGAQQANLCRQNIQRQEQRLTIRAIKLHAEDRATVREADLGSFVEVELDVAARQLVHQLVHCGCRENDLGAVLHSFFKYGTIQYCFLRAAFHLQAVQQDAIENCVHVCRFVEAKVGAEGRKLFTIYLGA